MRRRDFLNLIGGLAIAVPLTTAACFPAGLPGGAASLSEVHGKWLVSCKQAPSGKTCSFSQQHVDGSSRQRVFAIELQPAQAGGGVTGTLMLPFGLALEKGVKLQVDDMEPAAALPFRSCYPAGCAVPLTFDAEQIKAFGKGQELKIHVEPVDKNTSIALRMALEGFTGALARTTELLK